MPLIAQQPRRACAVYERCPHWELRIALAADKRAVPESVAVWCAASCARNHACAGRTRLRCPGRGSARRANTEEIAPFTHRIGRTRGHAWEQRDLASFAGMHRAPLWSPGNTGPIRVARQLVTLHDLFPYRFPDYHSRTFRIWYRTLHRALALRGVRFAAVSQYTRDEIVSLLGVAPERIAIVPGGVGPQFRPIERAVCERTVLRLGLPRRYVMALAMASQRKNLERLVEAWHLVRAAIKASNWYWPAGRSLGVFRVSLAGSLVARVAGRPCRCAHPRSGPSGGLQRGDGAGDAFIGRGFRIAGARGSVLRHTHCRVGELGTGRDVRAPRSQPH